jgi:lipopolysaccharide/colanic/teichoic acid biosynthesis glycosyltransferase
MGGYRSKRILDLAAAGTAFLVFAPIAAAVCIAIWLDDRGSPLISQPRIGDARQSFTILKFRSMKNSQVTRVGRWLRRTGIDELPQFVNVWRGDMSVVGPRPLTAGDIERLGWNDASHDWRYSTKPGITGISQLLAGRGARSCERLDRLYLRRQGLLLDLRLVALSFAVNVFGKREIRRRLRATGERRRKMRYSRGERWRRT